MYNKDVEKDTDPKMRPNRIPVLIWLVISLGMLVYSYFFDKRFLSENLFEFSLALLGLATIITGIIGLKKKELAGNSVIFRGNTAIRISVYFIFGGIIIILVILITTLLCAINTNNLISCG